MAYTITQKTRIALHDPSSAFPPGPTELTSLLDRGMREGAARGILFQARESVSMTVGTNRYTLSADHLQTFAILADRFSVSVRLVAQAGTAYWLQVSTAGALSFASSQPNGHTLLVHNTYWLEVYSANGTKWYVYPSALGAVTSSSSQPASGTGTASIAQLRDTNGDPWYIAVSNAGVVTATRSGSGSLMGPPVEAQAMQRIEPEAFLRMASRETTGKPQRYAIAGKTLYVHPTPDELYQLEHLYFSDSSTWQPTIAQYLPVGYAVAQSIRRRRMPAADTLLGRWESRVAMMSISLAPTSRDGMDMYNTPPRGAAE